MGIYADDELAANIWNTDAKRRRKRDKIARGR